MKPGPESTRRRLFAGFAAASLMFRNGFSGFETAFGQISNEHPRIRRNLPPLPDREGFAGMYAGVLGGKLIAGGGANFPSGYPWEGGRKFWYDDLYVLDSLESAKWNKIETQLPSPAGYGLSVAFENRLLLIGGEAGPSRAKTTIVPHCLDSVVSLQFDRGNIVNRMEPSLPEPLKDACGLVIGGSCYVFGGLTSPAATAASNRLYVLNSGNRDEGWQRGPDLPAAGRFQSVAGTDGRNLYVYSGIVPTAAADGSQARSKPYFREVWRFTPGMKPAQGKWTRLADMPREAAAAPSPALRTPSSGLLIASGATGADHSKPQKGHPGWSRDVMIHDTVTDSWRIVPNVFESGQGVVTAPTVVWGGVSVAVSGEIAPGRRTPALTCFEF